MSRRYLDPRHGSILRLPLRYDSGDEDRIEPPRAGLANLCNCGGNEVLLGEPTSPGGTVNSSRPSESWLIHHPGSSSREAPYNDEKARPHVRSPHTSSLLH